MNTKKCFKRKEAGRNPSAQPQGLIEENKSFKNIGETLLCRS